MKKNFREKCRYAFENYMSKGIGSKICFLGIITVFVVLTVGVLTFLVRPKDGFLMQLWYSFMHVLDTGNIAGNYDETLIYNIFMTLATLCGIFVTSGLFGIIATGLDRMLADMRKGKSKVMEKGHTTIIGFNEEIYTLLNELITANENHKGKCIVVVGEEDKEYMEAQIAARIKDFKGTRIVCRSGDISTEHLYEKCSLEDSKTIIVNLYDDISTIKIILATTKYLKNKDLYNPELYMVASILDEDNVEAAELAGEGMAEIICARDSVARIIAHTCRQKGLSKVVYELFNFSDAEIYFEEVPQLEGMTLKDAMNVFTNAVVLGMCKGDECMLNPPMDTVFEKGDRVILFEEDDGSFNYAPEKINISAENIIKDDRNEKYAEKLLVLGINEKLEAILEEYDKYSSEGTEVTIVSNKTLDIDRSNISNLKIMHIKENKLDKSILERILETDINYTVLVLSDMGKTQEKSDEETLLILIYLRNISKKKNKEIPITTEMRLTKNQHIAASENVQDFVISADIVNLLMTQVAENRELAHLFKELLSSDGSEMYMKKAEYYVPLNKEVNFYEITAAAAERREIAIGYKKKIGDSIEIVTNPNKADKICLTEKDYIIVVAEE